MNETAQGQCAHNRRAGKLSVVIPLFNEQASVDDTLARVVQQCRQLEVADWEIIAVDDGSRDATLEKLHARAEDIAELQVIAFTRNFGKEAAIHAGLLHSRGDIAVVMDGDGQHPADLLPRMLGHWQGGADVVAACKNERGSESLLTRSLASGFYSLFSRLTGIDVRGLSDYMLLDRVVVDQYCALRERQRFFRGMILWMGYPTARVYFDVPARAGGKSSWTRLKLFRLAYTAISAFTSKPLHLVTLLAAVYAIFALLLGAFTLYEKLAGNAVTGFATVIILILVTGALIMFGLGQIGLYIEQIFEELKHRPGYLIDANRSRLDRESSEP